MRSYEEMMELVLNVAKKDERIRAVGMNGSRVNPNVPKDMFQDYDIAFLVTDMESFISDSKWIDVFGEILIMQTPEAMKMFPPSLGGWFTYLMQFTDGNRIDLLLAPIDDWEKYGQADKLTVILLDKDHVFPNFPLPTDEDYWVKQPSQEFFDDCCNEFWWLTTYVAKGLWRKEFLYAQEHLELIRKMLIQMLEWQVGIETNFKISVGKNGKYLDKYLAPNLWKKLLSTYATADYENSWKVLFILCNLFNDAAIHVSNMLTFHYPKDSYTKVYNHLLHVKSLPVDAKVIY